MNRLVIVGNGFDLAHGLPTGYCHFIDWYWKKVIETLKISEILDYSDNLILIELRFKERNLYTGKNRLKKVESYSDMKTLIFDYSEPYYNSQYEHLYDRCKLQHYNAFFETICDKRHIQNWVDIENEYFKSLKNCLKENNDNSQVKKLNSEFEAVKALLEEYLSDVQQQFDFANLNKEGSQILNHFIIKPKGLQDDDYEDYLKEFPVEDHKDLVDFDNTVTEAYRNRNLEQDLIYGRIIQDNLILNFNYTQTFNIYNRIMWRNERDAYGYPKLIQIHGKLGDQDNKINFGFGDEMDDHYRLLEEKDDNEYLRNIKSFQYLQNSNYRDLLNFIEGEKFQVYIMGHSCGLSDRILLNTIFKHHNCRSIKVFYHEKDGRDNYTEIVQNISRHFNKKKLMREKIVNKSLCQPLPQNIRFAEK